MDKITTDFINNLVEKCAANPALVNQKANLENYFYRSMVETLIDNLNEEQLNQVKDLDLNSNEAQEKLQLFAAQVPGFINILDEKLAKEAENISITGQIPS